MQTHVHEHAEDACDDGGSGEPPERCDLAGDLLRQHRSTRHCVGATDFASRHRANPNTKCCTGTRPERSGCKWVQQMLLSAGRGEQKQCIQRQDKQLMWVVEDCELFHQGVQQLWDFEDNKGATTSWSRSLNGTRGFRTNGKLYIHTHTAVCVSYHGQ